MKIRLAGMVELGYLITRETRARGFKAFGVGAATGVLAALVLMIKLVLLRGISVTEIVGVFAFFGLLYCLGTLIGTWPGVGENRPHRQRL